MSVALCAFAEWEGFFNMSEPLLTPFRLVFTYEATPCESQAQYQATGKCSVFIGEHEIVCRVTPIRDFLAPEKVNHFQRLDVWFGSGEIGGHYSLMCMHIKKATDTIRAINRKRAKESKR